MIPEAPSCFPSNHSSHTYLDVNEDLVSSTVNHHQASSSTSNSLLLYSMSLLKEKVHQVQSLVTTFISPNQRQPSESNTIAITAMGTLIQEIIVTASSMMFTCQNLVTGSNPIENNTNQELHNLRVKPQEERGQGRGQGQGIYAREIHDWHNNNYDNFNMRDYSDRETVVVNQHKALSVPLPENTYATARSTEHTRARDLPPKDGKSEVSPNNYDIIELDAANLLAKYTHYCQVCGKGFKRDANLRMHMRAHGDEYKSSAALSNPMKNLRGQNGNNNEEDTVFPKKYSCPQEGCRWNKNHAKFQPLKSMICVKNHYKRSHCPKTYVCKRCNRKQFSVLSDLRTHEKHCGDLKWQCSCGNTFSRKDKLIGHLGLFVGHSPVMSSLTKTGRVKQTGQGP